MNSILQEMNSPTLEHETPCKGGIIYDTITNGNSEQFDIAIKFFTVGSDIVDYSYEIRGEHNIPANFLKEIVEEIIQIRK